MKKILFQGDSITDADRQNGQDKNSLGTGYPCLLAAELTYEDPNCTVYNCGISGNRVVDLFARWKKDCLNIEPDVLTILIGTNDVWHEFVLHNGVDTEKFETVYSMIIEETLKKINGIKIILMGAYLLHGTATDETWDSFDAEVSARREITKKLAQKYSLGYIDLQVEFNKALEIAPPSHWSFDGVHPTKAGHELIARAWRRVYNTL